MANRSFRVICAIIGVATAFAWTEPMSEEAGGDRFTGIGPSATGSEAAQSSAESASRPECGWQRTDDERIFGGQEARLGEYPWLAMIFYSRSNASVCLGALVGSRHVVTAAHCITGPVLTAVGSPHTVRLGEHDWTQPRDCYTDGEDCAPDVLNVRVASVYSHPQYVSKSQHQNNDVAVVVVVAPIEFTEYIQPICMPAVDDDLPVGTLVQVAGWGKTPIAATNNVKLRAEMEISDQGKCRAVYKRFSIDLSPSQICAGGDGKRDSCRGDSGGPLMYLDPATGLWTAYAIVSFGPKQCAKMDYPGVYTKFASHRAWITKLMATN